MATEAKHTPWADDTEYEDSTVTHVEAERSGWSITKADGWSFYVPGDSPVTPAEGMSVRMYGKGMGSVVRGLFLDGQCVFYRTEEEQRRQTADDLYGKDAADLIDRWDAGRTIFSIEMGGFGPGYEQALQIAMIEFLRHLVEGGDPEDPLTEKLMPLGLSGAQWGAARALAGRLYQEGPQATLEAFSDDRRIQVSKGFPTLDPVIVAAPDMLAVLKEARKVMAPSPLREEADAAIARAEGRSDA